LFPEEGTLYLNLVFSHHHMNVERRFATRTYILCDWQLLGIA